MSSPHDTPRMLREAHYSGLQALRCECAQYVPGLFTCPVCRLSYIPALQRESERLLRESEPEETEQHWHASTKRRVWLALLWLALAAGLYPLLVWLFPFGGWAK